MLKRFLKKVLKKDKIIIKKTDNEIVRYIKQTNMIEERKRYEELMKLKGPGLVLISPAPMAAGRRSRKRRATRRAKKHTRRSRS